MIYISAGHNMKGAKPDPGAVATHSGKPYREAEIAAVLRDKVSALLAAKGVKYINDKDEERLAEYIARIKPGGGSVLCEIHLNAGAVTATGTETLVKTAASTTEWDMARELTEGTAKILGIKSRGVKTEAQSQHGRLGVLHTPAGIGVLTEVCFIYNSTDVVKLMAHMDDIAALYADVLVKYENLVA